MGAALLAAIERFCAEKQISASLFGRRYLGDPRFVFDLRRGREPRPDTVAKVCDMLQESAGMRLLYLLKAKPKVVFYTDAATGQIAALFGEGEGARAVIADAATMTAVRTLLDPSRVSDLAI